jgi:uncharacterized membrane protein YphA (DoxX/SURF4 family)
MKAKTIVSWIVAVLLALAFVGAGTAKLTSQPMMVTNFAAWGFPGWFLYVTGAIEVVSAIMILIPRTALIGTALLICTMICALLTHLTHGQAAMIGAPLVLLLLLILFGWLRGWGRTARLSAAA